MTRSHTPIPAVLAAWASLALPAAGRADDRLAFFEERIRPVLVEHCYECHSTASAELGGGLLLDSRPGVLEGGDSGPALLPGKPAESLLLQAMRHESYEMPPTGKLPGDVIADFERWVRDGAVDPRDHPPTAAEAAEVAWQAKLAERRKWWSLQPIAPVAVPEETGSDGPAAPVDRFLRAAQEEAGVEPAPPADGTTLLRRLSFVLTGLPPDPRQVESFPNRYAADPDAALAELVDELLASPHFGERFARHWMDVVRYTDTYGYEWDNPVKGSFEYRDYLTRAFAADIGYDQMVREQIAGDLLPEPRIDEAQGVNESLIGPLFYHLGEHRHGSSLDFNGIHQEMTNNKIDAFSKAFLGLTVACARCHDHKLDAVSQADYYALAGVFMTPRWTPRDITAPQHEAAALAELKRLRAEARAALAKVWSESDQAVLRHGPALHAWATERQEQLAKAPAEEVGHPLAQLVAGTPWRQLADTWSAERAARKQANAANFRVLTDFREPGFPAGWAIDGVGLEHGYVAGGTPLVALEGDRLVADVLPRGYHTHALSSTLAGAIRLPKPETLPAKFVSLRMAGGEWAGRIDVPQNAFHNEAIPFFDPAAGFGWQAVTARPLKNGVTRVLTEFCTSSLNPNFPPRTGLARMGGAPLPNDDLGFDKRSWFSVTRIVAHDAPGAPADTLDAFVPLYASPGPMGPDETWQRVADWLAGAVARWAAGSASEGDVRIVRWLLAQGLLPNSLDAAPEVATLVEQYRAVEASVGFARSVNSMDERAVEPVDYRLNVRGNVDDEGPAIPRGFLEVFGGQQSVGAGPGSGRLELVEYLASGRNPLVARVYVNRVWHWVFGTGIVATPNDFGKLGDPPSHPELLDWLAAEFQRDGWSTKRLVRRLVLSQAFRQSGQIASHAAEVDPGNRLLHHYPTRRLEAEALRDSMLAVAGELDPRLFGRPIKPPRSAEDAKKRLFSGPLDGNGRRSLYLEMSIMEPPKFLVGFGLPDLKLPTGRRDVTNVPAQALILLNDPFVVQAAERWGHRVVADGSVSAAERLRRMFVHALGRPPTEEETQRWLDALAAFQQGEDTDPMSDAAAWAELAHTLFNTKEFLYYR